MPAIRVGTLIATGALALCVGAFALPSVAQQQHYVWSISKSVQHATADMHPGDNQEFGYTVGVTKTPVDAGDPAGIDAEAVNVSDSNGSSWLFDASGAVEYSAMHGCVDHQSYAILNTASIVETGASATADAQMFCHVLRIVRSIEVVHDGSWTWNITKTHAEVPPLMMTAGQTYNVPYTITAVASAGEGAMLANGQIEVTNTNPVKMATLESVAVDVSGLGPADVDCPTLVIAAGSSLVCSFSVALPDSSNRTATVTVTQLNFDHALNGEATPNGGTRQFVGKLLINPSDATGNEIDRCVNLSDSYLGGIHDLGTACAEDSPIVRYFTGAIVVSDDSACELNIENLATLVTQDSGTELTDSTDIAVLRTDCDENTGCVRTPGYWKTHSSYGPAPLDPVWAQIGEDTAFFLATDSQGTPLSWYQVLWTSPKQGNAYFILSRAYIAAILNGLSGASASDQVLDALTEAEALFSTWTVQQVGALRGKQAPRPRMIELAGILDMYNNGMGDLGPPSCSEDVRSVSK